MPASFSPPRASTSPPAPGSLATLSLEAAQQHPLCRAFQTQRQRLRQEEAVRTRMDRMEGRKNRCATCKKKLGLTGFTCRCGGLFCSIHRYSDKHQCDFDYKALGAEEITRSNPVVVAQKVAKI